MKTITLKEFTDNFMEISNNLTYAEIQMLYLIITEPDVINISRQNFADKIGTHRRTIWLGIKKLQKLNYVSDINVKENGIEESDINITNKEPREGNKDITYNDIDATKNARISKYDKLLNEYLIDNK